MDDFFDDSYDDGKFNRTRDRTRYGINRHDGSSSGAQPHCGSMITSGSRDQKFQLLFLLRTKRFHWMGVIF